jgi:transposase
MITINNTNYLTIKDISKKFDVTNKCVYDWIKRGLLKGTRISERKIYFLETDIQNFLEGK